jgi:hypothetical protein
VTTTASSLTWGVHVADTQCADLTTGSRSPRTAVDILSTATSYAMRPHAHATFPVTLDPLGDGINISIITCLKKG